MKLNFTLVLLFSSFAFNSLFSQTVLTSSNNGIQFGDDITLTRVDTVSPGNSGANQLWDFSSAETFEDFVINLNVGDENNSKKARPIVCVENNARTVYLETSSNKQLYYGLSADDVEVKFDQPLVELTYPFEFGSEITGVMTGTYTKKGFSTPITGTYSVKADAWGTLILPNGVKLNNVLRVTSIREYNHEFSGSDYHFTVIRYAYYAPGNRYSVFQIKDVIYDCVNCACDGKEYKVYYDSRAKAMNSVKPVVSNVKYEYKVYPNPFENDVNIEYSIQAPAKIRMSMVDMSGKEVKVILNKSQEAGEYSVVANMAGHQSAYFILRMEVNDILYSEKLIQKKGACKQ